jgi:2,3-bisphosphoglycerate-dependent phosphoglycerate mutase
MPTIFLIRHGESKANAGFATSDPKRIILTERGFDQARDVAHFLHSKVSLDLIVTSPYLRAIRTAERTKLVFPDVCVEEWKVQEFTYLTSMHRESTTIEDRRPLVDLYWEIGDPSFVDGPGSESFEQFIERVRNFLTKLRETDYSCIAVFSHEQFIRAALMLMEQESAHEPVEVSPTMMRDFRASLKKAPIPNGGIVEVKFHPGYDGWNYKHIAVEPKPSEQKVAVPTGH